MTKHEYEYKFANYHNIILKGSEDPVTGLIYRRQNEETLQLSKSLLKSGFIFAEVFLFPYTFASFFLYYTTDLGEDSFRPLFPSM